MKKAGEKITRAQAEALLKKYAPDTKTFQLVLQHSQAVQKAALSLAQAIKKHGHKINFDLIKTGSLLHDIGRFSYPPHAPSSLKHGIAGGNILRKEKLPLHACIAENHIGSGISKEEIIQQKLPLPKKDFLPTTLEEKIIAYADNLTFQDRLATPDQVVQKFKKENLPLSAIQRLTALHNEIEKLRGGSEKL